MGSRSKQRRRQKEIEEKNKILKKCELAGECKYVSTCPTCGHRICNANSKCCYRCAGAEMCPMRGIQ